MFKLVGKFNLSEITDKTRTPSHHHTIRRDDMVYYFRAVKTKRKVKPKLYAIRPIGYGDAKLIDIEFDESPFFNSSSTTTDVISKINHFFTKLHVYKKHKISVPKRSILLYGPSGSGKTSVIQEICKSYLKDGKTAVILWGTNDVDASVVKDLFRDITYVGVDRLIFIMEDLGGTENPNRDVESDAALLSLLDNKEKAFKIPTLIISTTNYPEMLFENIANRPGRFDHKIEAGYPKPKDRSALLKFLSQDTVSQEILDSIEHKDYDQFTPAHLNELVFRVELYDITYEVAIEQIASEIKEFKSSFKKPKKLGI